MRDILFVGAVLYCALTALRRPVFGMWAYVGFSLALPHSMTWGFGRSFPFAQVLALATLLGWFLSREPKSIPLRREGALMLGLWCFFAVTSFGADYPDRAWVKTIDLAKILLMVFVSMSLISDRYRLRILMLVYTLSLGFHAAKGGAYFIASGGTARIWGPERSFLEANNSIGLAMAMNLPLLFHLRALETRPILRRIMEAMIFFTYPAVIGTFSRGAWMGLATATVVLIWTSRRRFTYGVLAAALFIAILPYMPARVVNRYQDLTGYEADDSAQSRLWSWRFATRVAVANPVFGAGFDYYGIPAYEKYWPEFLDRWPNSLGWSCHSIWFTILSEHGFTGIALWVALLASCLLSLRTLARGARGSPDEVWVTGYTRMIFAAFAAYMVSGTFLDAAYFDIFYQLVAVIVIMRVVLERPEPEIATEPDVARPQAVAD